MQALAHPKKEAMTSQRNLNRKFKRELQASQHNHFYIESYGCQMNEYDSGLVCTILKESGYQQAQSIEEAQIILLNTCAIREKAQEKIYHRLEHFLPLKQRNSQTIVGILGCMAQNIGDDLFNMGLPLDLVMGPDNYRQLPQVLKNIQSDTSSAARWNLTHLSRNETYSDLQAQVVTGKLAFITIMRGCDNFCSFCVVPYTRGRERSCDPAAIVSEIQQLIEQHDIRELTLLGQNVNSYRYDGMCFHDLVVKILNETGIQRIRFTSPHPHDFPQELLELMAQEERFCSQIHLPLQSGSSSVLERMKRDYNRNTYLELVKQIRQTIPNIALSTDVIVGFCGESDSEFQETLSLMEEVEFDMAYMFRYSERGHTWAQKHLKDDIPEEVKQERLQQLIVSQRKRSLKINTSLIGKSFTVLVEGYSKRSRSELMGRTSSGKVIIFKPQENKDKDNPASLPADPNFIGQMMEVRVVSASSATMAGVALGIS